MSLENLPEAEHGMWHRVNTHSMTRAMVMGESVLTQCGKRLHRVTHTGAGSGRLADAPMPPCPACDTIHDYLNALREERSAPMQDARRLV